MNETANNTPDSQNIGFQDTTNPTKPRQMATINNDLPTVMIHLPNLELTVAIPHIYQFLSFEDMGVVDATIS